MPVTCDVNIGHVGQERFHAVDKVVMRHAFDIHNTLGRFCDERVYQDWINLGLFSLSSG